MILNITEALKACKVVDAANIRLVPMAGDADFTLYAAELAPFAVLRPHVHRRGNEIYQIVSGQGMIRVGRESGGKPLWDEELPMNPLDCLTVEPGKAHQLLNTGETPLIAVFICPADHLGTDREFLSEHTD